MYGKHHLTTKRVCTVCSIGVFTVSVRNGACVFPGMHRYFVVLDTMRGYYAKFYKPGLGVINLKVLSQILIISV